MPATLKPVLGRAEQDTKKIKDIYVHIFLCMFIVYIIYYIYMYICSFDSTKAPPKIKKKYIYIYTYIYIYSAQIHEKAVLCNFRVSLQSAVRGNLQLHLMEDTEFHHLSLK